MEKFNVKTTTEAKREEMLKLYELAGSVIAEIRNCYEYSNISDSDIIELMKLRVLMDIKDSIDYL